MFQFLEAERPGAIDNTGFFRRRKESKQRMRKVKLPPFTTHTLWNGDVQDVYQNAGKQHKSYLVNYLSSGRFSLVGYSDHLVAIITRRKLLEKKRQENSNVGDEAGGSYRSIESYNLKERAEYG